MSLPARALEFPLPAPGNNIVGSVQTVESLEGDTFHSIGRYYDIGFYELREANPTVNPEQIPPGTKLTVPSRFILPPGPREGLVVNLAEMRIYYYPRKKQTVITEPIGIGRLGWQTPQGLARITAKVKNPTWYVPASIKAFAQERGITLPNKVLPGPDNPLGKYALKLSFPGYLIHGTNEPTGVGMRSSSGCIRMFPEDIETLFREVKLHDLVRVLNSPYKIGWDGKSLYLEAHQPLQEDQLAQNGQNKLTPMIRQVLTQSRPKTSVNWSLAERIGLDELGYPRRIGGLSNLSEKNKKRL